MERGPPPPGGDESKAGKTIAIHATLTGLSVIAVAFRSVARAKGSKHFRWDDWTMLIALVSPL